MTTVPIASRPRILVVDDLEPVRIALARSLRQAFSTATAPSAHAALKLLSNEPFDAVLTDFDMPPGPDGVWLLVECARLHPTTRRFLGTGSPIAQFQPHQVSGVIEAVLQKPIASAAFLAAYRRQSH